MKKVPNTGSRQLSGLYFYTYTFILRMVDKKLSDKGHAIKRVGWQTERKLYKLIPMAYWENQGIRVRVATLKKTYVSVSRNINCRFNSYRANFNIKSELLEQNNEWLRIHFCNIFKNTQQQISKKRYLMMIVMQSSLCC